MSRSIIIAALLATVLAFYSASAYARPTYGAPWASTYPASSSLSNVTAGAVSNCQLCHSGATGFQPWNAYGWSIRQQMKPNNELIPVVSLAVALSAVEGLDSDGDGATNLAEINASTQPGWTVGANNTLFFATGVTTPGQTAPAAIIGSLDAVAVPGVGLIGGIALALGAALSGTAHSKRQKSA